jgi:hypothetical protein
VLCVGPEPEGVDQSHSDFRVGCYLTYVAYWQYHFKRRNSP